MAVWIPTVEGAGRDLLVDQVRRLSSRYDWVILDGPPGISNVSADAVRVADVVLIPAKASAFDVWAATELGLPVLQSRTTDRVAYTQAGNDGTSVLEGPDRTAHGEILAIRHELEQLSDDN